MRIKQVQRFILSEKKYFGVRCTLLVTMNLVFNCVKPMCRCSLWDVCSSTVTGSYYTKCSQKVFMCDQDHDPRCFFCEGDVIILALIYQEFTDPGQVHRSSNWLLSPLDPRGRCLLLGAANVVFIVCSGPRHNVPLCMGGVLLLEVANAPVIGQMWTGPSPPCSSEITTQPTIQFEKCGTGWGRGKGILLNTGHEMSFLRWPYSKDYFGK